jgi:hypothetical protein
VVLSSEAVPGYTVAAAAAAAAAATAILRTLLEAAVVERHGHNPQAEEATVGVCDRAVGCSLGCSYPVFGQPAADTTVEPLGQQVRVSDQEEYSSGIPVVVEASAVVDS